MSSSFQWDTCLAYNIIRYIFLLNVFKYSIFLNKGEQVVEVVGPKKTEVVQCKKKIKKKKQKKEEVKKFINVNRVRIIYVYLM